MFSIPAAIRARLCALAENRIVQRSAHVLTKLKLDRIAQHNSLRALCRARTASAKAEAHFSTWGHTEALCGSILA
jgi:hypothetical protein